jgi:hypothetical protein
LSGKCPAERECYSLYSGCATTLCVVPDGVHCTDTLSCNPGDATTTSDDPDCSEYPTPCYGKWLCTSYIYCKHSKDAGVDSPAPDAAVDVGTSDAGYCGDGIVGPGEECDLGSLNGVSLDTSSSPWTPNPNGVVWCNSSCRNPHPLCVPLPKLGGMSCD